MGGNALSVITIRMPASNYGILSDVILDKLSGIKAKHKIIPSYKMKPDFGDMDILFSNDGFDRKEVVEILGGTEMVINDTVTSTGVKVKGGIFQIDLITVPEDCFDFALAYFSHNDLGNLLGRVFHKAGFKLGHLGLQYVVRPDDNPDQVIAELCMTKDWSAALEFVGYSSEGYFRGAHGGFRSLEDLFNFAVSSKYSNPDIYLLENRNNISRTRDRKRKTYMEFLTWLETAPSDLPIFDWSDKAGIRGQFLQNAFIVFPEFKAEYDAVMKKHEDIVSSKSKFSGEIVKERTGLEGKELGEVMKSITTKLGSRDDVVKFANSATTEDINKLIDSVVVVNSKKDSKQKKVKNPVNQ